MLHTGLYILDIRAYNFDVAHLYEHLLIRAFQDTLSAQGYPPVLAGWIGGETFRDAMFIDYGLYDERAEKILQDFISSTPRISLDDLPAELARIEVEESAEITIELPAVQDMLAKIDTEIFTKDVPNINFTPYTEFEVHHVQPDILKLHKAKAKFRDVTIKIRLSNPTTDQLTTLLRMSPLIHDVTSQVLQREYGSYEQATSWARRPRLSRDATLTAIHSVRRKGATLRDIKKVLPQIPEQLQDNLTRHKSALDHYREAFLSTPNWNSFPIDYHRYAGLVTTKQNIAAHLTYENMLDILNNLSFAVHETNDEDWRACA